MKEGTGKYASSRGQNSIDPKLSIYRDRKGSPTGGGVPRTLGFGMDRIRASMTCLNEVMGSGDRIFSQSHPGICGLKLSNSSPGLSRDSDGRYRMDSVTSTESFYLLFF